MRTDPRTDLAELRAQVRHLADEFGDVDAHGPDGAWFAEKLRALVGPWPHEQDDDEDDCDFGETWAEGSIE